VKCSGGPAYRSGSLLRNRTSLVVTATAVAALSSRDVFVVSVMARITYVAISIPRLVGMEMVVRLFPALWVRPTVAVTGIVAVVDMPIKPMMAVKPGPSADEYTASEPVGPIVTIRCTVIGGEVVVAVRAHRRNPDIDGYLCRRARKAAQHGRSQSKKC
jgi:hypothetical protein